MHGFLNDRPTDDDLDDFDDHAEYLLNFIGIVCMRGWWSSIFRHQY